MGCFSISDLEAVKKATATSSISKGYFKCYGTREVISTTRARQPQLFLLNGCCEASFANGFGEKLFLESSHKSLLRVQYGREASWIFIRKLYKSSHIITDPIRTFCFYSNYEQEFTSTLTNSYWYFDRVVVTFSSIKQH